jgi:hypothetical protein
MKTAAFIKKLDDWRSDARLFRLSHPMECRARSEDGYEDTKTEYVVVSSVFAAYSGPETFIFPAREDGEVLSMLEMSGSQKGDVTHEQALSDAGYAVEEVA